MALAKEVLTVSGRRLAGGQQTVRVDYECPGFVAADDKAKGSLEGMVYAWTLK